MAIWDKDNLDFAEAKREKRRKKQPRQTFDCFNAHVRGDRVVCVAGHRLTVARDGSMYLISVLNGTTASVCKTCPDFDGEVNEG